MPKHILFWPDVYLEQGHWLPTIVWANGLKAQGHTVSYMGIRDCAAVVQPFGFVESPGPGQGKFTVIFEDLYPLGYSRTSLSQSPRSYTSNRQPYPDQRWKPDHIFAIANGALDALFTGPAKPDLLVSGYFTSLESLLIGYKYGVEVVTTTTFLRHPQDEPASRALQNLIGFPRAVARKLMRDVLGTAWNPQIQLADFVKPMETVNELIPCPQELEFSHYQHRDKLHYVEPCITPDEPDFEDAAFWARIPTDKNLLYATAGSQVQDYEQKALHWFEQMILMMNSPQMAGFHLILAVGPKLAKRAWGTSSLFTVASWVPQRAILAHGKTRAALVHGGLATIKECIYFDKPFAVLPMGKDQMDNALRLRQKSIAPFANANSIDSDRLLQLVNKLLSDPWMASRRSAMGAIFRNAENTAKPGLALLLNRLGA